MTTRQLLVKTVFEDGHGQEARIAARYFTDRTYRKVENLENIMSLLKKAFYRKKSLKGVELIGVVTEQKTDYFFAIVPDNLFTSDANLAEVEIVDEGDIYRINFISLATGEIIQGVAKK